MSQFDVIAGPDATPVYPNVRKIGPADLKDALAKGIDDFLAMPSSHVFLGLIYPIAGLCLAGYALPLLFHSWRVSLWLVPSRELACMR
jgi:uncharacterized membrane protein